MHFLSELAFRNLRWFVSIMQCAQLFSVPVIIIIILFSIRLNFNFNPRGTASVLLSQATCQYISFILGSIQQKHAFYLQLRNSFVSGNFKYLERFVSTFALKRVQTQWYKINSTCCNILSAQKVLKQFPFCSLYLKNCIIHSSFAA